MCAAKPGVQHVPRVECEQGKRWIVEHHTGNNDLIISDANSKQSVYIFNCSQSTIQVNGIACVKACSHKTHMYEVMAGICSSLNLHSHIFYPRMS